MSDFMSRKQIEHPSGTMSSSSRESEHVSHKSEIDLVDLIVTFWRSKRLVGIVTGLFIVGSIVLALVLPPVYEATTTLMPISSDQNSGLSQYAGLAALAGVSLPNVNTSTPDQKIVAILESRTLAEGIVKNLDLVPLIVKDYRRITNRDPVNVAVERLQKDISVNEDNNTGVISVKVSFGDATMAQRIANTAVKVLQATLNEKNFTVSKMSIRALQEQIDEQEKKVTDLQSQLARFQKDTKIISPEGQVTSAMALYGSLLQQKIAVEVSLSRLENALSPDNPQVTATRAQLEAVNQQIGRLESTTGVGSFSMGNAPAQIVEYENISRDLEIATKIYGGLLANYENQKLQEAQDQLFVEVIDRAIRPDLRTKPNRKVIVIFGAILGLLGGTIAAFGAKAITNLRREISERTTP